MINNVDDLVAEIRAAQQGAVATGHHNLAQIFENLVTMAQLCARGGQLILREPSGSGDPEGVSSKATVLDLISGEAVAPWQQLVEPKAACLDEIAAILFDGKDWDSSTTEDIAELVRQHYLTENCYYCSKECLVENMSERLICPGCAAIRKLRISDGTSDEQNPLMS